MNEWPIDRQLDEKLRRMVLDEVAAADARQIGFRARPARHRALAGTGVALAAVVVLVAALAWRAQSVAPVAGPSGSPSPAPTTAVSPSPEETASASPASEPSGTAAPAETIFGCQANGALVALADGRVLLADGYQSLIFDPKTKTFSQTGTMGSSRSFASSILLPDGRVLVAGGWDLTTQADATTDEIFDPKTGQFTSLGPVAPHDPATSVVLSDGRVLIVGPRSMSPSLVPVPQDIFDPATGTFSATGGLTGPSFRGTGSGQLSAVLLGDGRALVVQVSDDRTVNAQTYDPATNSFKAITGTDVPRQYAACLAPLPDGRAMLFGGGNSIVEAFDPSSNSFARLASMSGTADVAGFATLTDGRILVLSVVGQEEGRRAGNGLMDPRPMASPDGRPDGATYSVVIEAQIYDPAADKWIDAGQLAYALMGVYVAPLPGGGAMVEGTVAGGGGEDVEILDPKTGKFVANQ